MDLLNRRAVCAMVGGSQPIDASTLYRWIAAGKFPRPVKLSPGTSRWLKAEVEAALQRMLEARR